MRHQGLSGLKDDSRGSGILSSVHAGDGGQAKGKLRKGKL